jgi:hypothetical protein
MSVYRVEAAKASCRVSGCRCRDRVPRYPVGLGYAMQCPDLRSSCSACGFQKSAASVTWVNEETARS